MELAVESDIYCPSVDANGNYIDKIPAIIEAGLRCPCNARKNKIYVSYATFYVHIKTKAHQTWLEDLNLNKQNFIKENTNLKRLCMDQRLIIARLEKDVSIKDFAYAKQAAAHCLATSSLQNSICYLTQQLASKDANSDNNNGNNDLIDFLN